ncbi:MAG: type II secretion system F family protein [Deltaproteobacteria bacterium]|nr:type II secretion system F family protein [Deltaproteobacteria bacterium]MBW1929392.1 type II secretion system F family protein [Deltaproteobacteria bacterium]MBW2025563.1 type II secretion system F family protein [Deltaproteobacteria bacterium]MBW2126709.1 type II secretion system F family protein [Deltaproteobacteria bacterium]RLB20172.1 MAG: type II secretion system F family protein [Deltaproteobacteria bacterium]
MPNYRCKLTTPDGKVVQRRFFASSKASLKENLEREGNFVLEIKRAEALGELLRFGGIRKAIKTKDFLTFNQEFLVLIKAGLPILSALDTIIQKGGKEDFVEILKEIRNDVAGGASLSAAFSRFRHLFSGLYVATLRAGEKSGNIADALARHIQYLKKVEEVRKKVISASVYPAILTVVSLFALVFLLTYVVPTFTKTYFEAGTPLPALTLILVHFTEAIRTNIIGIGALIFFLVFGFYYLRRTEAGSLYLNRIKLKIPFFGSLYLHYYLSRFARTLAMVLAGGIPLLEAVRISTGTLRNRFIRERLDQVTQLLEQGQAFSESLSKASVLPDLALRMIDAGENSGALEDVLMDLAEFYEGDVETRLSIITSAIEPGLMIIMGLLIGFVVLAMYLPIFQMASTVG